MLDRHRRKLLLSLKIMVFDSKGANGTKIDAPADGAKKNKQRVLMLSSRGITYRYGLKSHSTRPVALC